MFNSQFFPTPARIIKMMATQVDFNKIKTVLEPSAGRGDIIDYLYQQYKMQSYRFGDKLLDVDAIEVCPDLRHILRGKGIRVIHDDFLTFHTLKRYDLIIMNPPFSCADKHLLKALDMQRAGGQIVCLLNAETLRNPYTNTRKDLMQQLEDFDAEVEFIGSVFADADAERKTKIEVALVKIKIPISQDNKKSIILEGLRKTESFERQGQMYYQSLTHWEFIERIVSQYQFEAKAGLALITEYKAMQPLIGVNDGQPLLRLTLHENTKVDQMDNLYVEAVRRKYWKTLFDSPSFTEMLTSNLRTQFYDKMEELKNYDFSAFNILQIQEVLSKNLLKSVEETIVALFDELSHRWHWADESSKNIRYYNGWKTNKAWVINKKVIIPNMSAWTEYNQRIYLGYRVYEKLQDIEKVFNYLDGGMTDHINLQAVLKKAEENKELRKIPLKYFKVSFFKKGTCHIEFTKLDLLKKFNLFGSQQKGWLPPNYGETYDNLTKEEKAIIDSFEGREEYERVCRNKRYFLSGLAEPLRLSC